MNQELNYPWTIRQGADFNFQVTWQTGAPPSAPSPVGATATCIIYPSPTDVPAISISTTLNAQGLVLLSQTTVGFGLQASSALLIDVTIFASATAGLPVGTVGGITGILGATLTWVIVVTFPPNSKYPAGQNWPFGHGAVYVEAQGS